MSNTKIIGAFTLAAIAVTPVIAAVPSATYVMKAGASDLFERESAKVELQSTTNPALKSFAQMMITDHTQSTAEVKSAAMKAGLHPAPPKLTAKQSSDLAALKRASGAARDTLYVRQQKASHQEALALHQEEAQSGTAAPLKMTAAKVVPVVQHHIQLLSSM